MNSHSFFSISFNVGSLSWTGSTLEVSVDRILDVDEDDASGFGTGGSSTVVSPSAPSAELGGDGLGGERGRYEK